MMIPRRSLLTQLAASPFAAQAAAGGRRHFPNVPLLTQDNRSVRFYDDLAKTRSSRSLLLCPARICPRRPELVNARAQIQIGQTPS